MRLLPGHWWHRRSLKTSEVRGRDANLAAKQKAGLFQSLSNYTQRREIRVKKDLSNDKTAAWFQDPLQLPKSSVLVADLTKHAYEVSAVENIVGIREVARIAIRWMDVRNPSVGCPPSDFAKHLTLHVQHDKQTTRRDSRGDSQRVSPNPWADFEQALSHARVKDSFQSLRGVGDP